MGAGWSANERMDLITGRLRHRASRRLQSRDSVMHPVQAARSIPGGPIHPAAAGNGNSDSNQTMKSIFAQAAIPSLGLLIFGVVAVALLVVVVLVINFGMIYIRALFSGAKVTLTELIALRLRRVPVGLIVDNRITAVKSGLPLSIDDLSTHYLAGGNVPMVVLALIAAKKAGINLIFDRACAIDLATKGTGKTVLEAVKTSVNPKVIDCPRGPSAVGVAMPQATSRAIQITFGGQHGSPVQPGKTTTRFASREDAVVAGASDPE